MSKPRLTYVLWGLDRAGAERMVFDLVDCLKDRYQIRVISAGGGGAMEPEFRALGIEVSIAPKGIGKRGLLAFFWKEFREHRPDILHTHLGGDVWAGMVAWAQRLHPWISTVHNVDQDDPWTRTVLRRWAAKRVDQTVCVSGAVKVYAEKELHAPQQTLSVIPNGIDLREIQMRPSRPFRDTPQLLTVGRLVKQKGQDVLLKALARVKRPWRLDVCGEGPERLRLERLTESLGLLPRVRFLGNVTDVKRRLSEADLFCFPSRWEGQGITLLEAAASATPLLLSDLPVFREWFDESSAQFAPPEDVDAWTEALERCLQEPDGPLHSAGRARVIVQARGSRETMAESYHELYTRWLNTYAHTSSQ